MKTSSTDSLHAIVNEAPGAQMHLLLFESQSRLRIFEESFNIQYKQLISAREQGTPHSQEQIDSLLRLAEKIGAERATQRWVKAVIDIFYTSVFSN